MEIPIGSLSSTSAVNKDLQDVLRELSKAPGGVTQPKSKTPGPILGGPREPGVIKDTFGPGGTISTAQELKRQPPADMARGLYRYYKTGEMPAPVKDISTNDVKIVRPASAEAARSEYEKIQQKKIDRLKLLQELTIENLKRPPGSKPKTLTQVIQEKKLEKQIAKERASSREVIQKKLTTPTKAWSWSYGTAEEQKLAELEARKEADRIARREAKIQAKAMQRDLTAGEVNPLAESTVTGEAKRRADEALRKENQAKTEQKQARLAESKRLIIHSGGAAGADSAWANAGKKSNINVIAHSFQGHKVAEGKPFVHSQSALNAADNLLIKVRKEYMPYKQFETSKEFVKNLLRRNFFQIKDSQALFAIGKIEDTPVGKRVAGGTSWAFYMAVDQNKPAYIFNQKDNTWYKAQGKELVPIDRKKIPRYTEIAGVGSRDLTEAGRKEIQDFIKNRMGPKSAPTNAKPAMPKRPGLGAMPPIMPGGGLLEQTR